MQGFLGDGLADVAHQVFGVGAQEFSGFAHDAKASFEWLGTAGMRCAELF
jgi:hypothetical protein